MALGEPPDTGRFHAWLSLYPNLRFKLDANSQWTDGLLSELVATSAVDSIDFKGYYQGTTVDTPPDAALYRRVAEGLPEAWLEDPHYRRDDPCARASSRPHYLGCADPLGTGHRGIALAPRR
jgi:hypothetical protein